MNNIYQRAYEDLKNKININKPTNPEQITLYEDLKLIQELVDKETPMKVEWRGVLAEGTPYCPKCKWYCLSETYTNRYRCRECNQKLDWSDE